MVEVIRPERAERDRLGTSDPIDVCLISRLELEHGPKRNDHLATANRE